MTNPLNLWSVRGGSDYITSNHAILQCPQYNVSCAIADHGCTLRYRLTSPRSADQPDNLVLEVLGLLRASPQLQVAVGQDQLNQPDEVEQEEQEDAHPDVVQNGHFVGVAC